MVKDVHLARSLEEASRADASWELPPDAYFKLQGAIWDERGTFPLLYSIVAHDYGSDGDFAIRPDQTKDLVREIDTCLEHPTLARDEDVRHLLKRLRRVAQDAAKAGLTVFGVAD